MGARSQHTTLPKTALQCQMCIAQQSWTRAAECLRSRRKCARERISAHSQHLVPVFNEAKVLPELVEGLQPKLGAFGLLIQPSALSAPVYTAATAQAAHEALEEFASSPWANELSRPRQWVP